MRAGFLGLERLQSALLVLLILLFGAVAEYLALQEQRRTDAQQVRDTVESAAQLRALLEMELNAPLQLSQGLVAHVQALEGNKAVAAENNGNTQDAGVLLSTDQIEWEHIQRVLAQQDGNISQTARLLGMHRRTLQRKLLKHRPG